jgi:hypothetical protein
LQVHRWMRQRHIFPCLKPCQILPRRPQTVFLHPLQRLRACVHVCGCTTSRHWQFLVHLNWEQHESEATCFSCYCYLESMLVYFLRQQEGTTEKRTEIRPVHKWNRDETRTGHGH